MSDKLTDDKKVTRGARSDKLVGVEVSKRDEIVIDLAKRLKKLDIANKVEDLWHKGNADRQHWLNRQRAYLRDYDEHKTSTADGPFTGSSNLHIPMPLTVIKSVHARFLQALWLDPPVHTRARAEASGERAAAVQDTMVYALKDWANEYEGAFHEVDQWIWDWVSMGSGILKLSWDRKYDVFTDVELGTELENQTIINEFGEQIEVAVAVQAEVEVDRQKEVFNGPLFERKEHEDVIIVGGKGSPQAADAVIETQFLTASDLWTLADQGVFDAAEVKSVIAGGPDKLAGQESNLKQDRSENAGNAQLDDPNELDRYAIRESYLTMDVKGSGINSKVVTWTHARSRALLRATYLRRVNKSGEVPYFKIDYLNRPGQDYGVGLLEMLHPLSVEMDAMHNMRIDYGIISTMPYGFYRPSSSINPEILQMQPGTLFPVDNPQTDVFFPNLGNRTSFGMQEEASLQQMVERLTGVSDLSLGVLSGNQGATRTATGTRALVAESNTNLDVFLRRLRKGWKQSLRYLFHMLQQRLPEGLEFRVTGDDGQEYFRIVRNADDLAGNFDFDVSANSADSNPQISIAKANQVLQMVMNPLLIQMGVVTSGNIFESVKNWMRANGINDFGRFITSPPDHVTFLSPEEEANRVLRDIPTPVVPQMDHEGFIDYAELLLNSEDLLAQYGEPQIRALSAQADAHKQMAGALQQAQAQAANAQQVQTNSQLGAQPGLAPTLTAVPGGNGEAQ